MMRYAKVRLYMMVQGLSTDQDSLTCRSYSIHRPVVFTGTAPKSHVSVFLSPASVSLPVCCVLAVFSLTASLAVPLLVRSHRQVPGLASAISATEGPSCRPAGSETQSWLTRQSTIWAPSREACLPAWARAEEDCSGGGNDGGEGECVCK